MTENGNVFSLGDKHPQIADDVFIAPGAQVMGDVTIGKGSSIWFNCVLRGDVNTIEVGEGTNIQDGTVVHVSRRTHPTVIGSNVLIGHMAMVHGCILKDWSFVGLGSIVMDGCVVEEDGMLAAGAMLTPGKVIGKGELWGGRPAKLMRTLTEEQITSNRTASPHYAQLAQVYRSELKVD
ncbi:MAG: gamma carbonic anhydrase family protein [Pseudomonadota bacterium]